MGDHDMVHTGLRCSECEAASQRHPISTCTRGYQDPATSPPLHPPNLENCINMQVCGVTHTHTHTIIRSPFCARPIATKTVRSLSARCLHTCISVRTTKSTVVASITSSVAGTLVSCEAGRWREQHKNEKTRKRQKSKEKRNKQTMRKRKCRNPSSRRVKRNSNEREKKETEVKKNPCQDESNGTDKTCRKTSRCVE
jgi:hypothetical protein